MFKNGIPIGKILGIDVRLHTSWFFIMILVTWTLTSLYFPATYPAWSMPMSIGAGLLTSFLYFSSVLVHEMCHSLVAVREGIEIKSITLFFLGGVSEMTGEPKTARDEFRMAAAGPFSSLVLGGIFLGISFALRGSSALAAQFITGVSFYLGYINVFLGVFNLIPGFPLDGGRIFRSIIWGWTKDLQRATKIASGIGRTFGYLFIFGGMFLIFSGDVFNGVWLAFIGWFLNGAAMGSYSQMRIQDILKGHTASEIMTQDCTAVPPDMSIEHFVNEIMLSSGRRCYPVVWNDQTEGLITLADVKSVDRDAWSTTPVRQAMTPLDRMKTVSPEEDLSTVLKYLAEHDVNQVPVVKDHVIVGMIARDSIISFINVHTQLTK